MQTQKALTDAAGQSGFPTKGGAGHCWLSRIPADTATVSKASAGEVSPQSSPWAGSGRVLGEHPFSLSPCGRTGDKGKKGALGQGVTSIPSSKEADHY